VTVSETEVPGYAWGENIGWTIFAPQTGGVKTPWIGISEDAVLITAMVVMEAIVPAATLTR